MVIAKGQQMLASDILSLNFLPIGTILMYDGIGWMDNTTIPGWYKCDGDNNTPNLINKFIRGALSAGDTGGADNVKLTTNYLPQHSHPNTVENGTLAVNANNNLTGTLGTLDDREFVATGVFSHTSNTSGGDGNGKGCRVAINVNHGHALSGKISISNANAGQPEGTITAVPTIPVYYTLIYIRKCFNR